MSLLKLPIPPKPAAFTPEGAPPGVAVDFDAQHGFHLDGKPNPSVRYWQTRPKIKPRVAIVHTNAALREGTLQSQINWGNASPQNTHPTYCVNWPQPTKLLPSDRRSVANSTEDFYEREHAEVDSSFWTLSIETADTGTLNDPKISDFLEESTYGPIAVPHAEIVARILAYESIVHDFPLTAPRTWNGTGVAAHTHPFPWPAYTTVEGKTCPGLRKTSTLFAVILPRARQIKAAWLAAPQPDPDPGVPTVEYFTLVDQPTTLWGSSDGLSAVRIELSVMQARGINHATVPVKPPADAAKFVYLNGLTSASVR